MSRRLQTKFIGSLRLVPKVDTIGLPIFMALQGNQIFVPEMDGDLRISEFLEFYNEANYPVTYELPKEFMNKIYEVGGSTPIPFWISDECHVIVGDADKDEPRKLFGNAAQRNPVLLDLARVLDDARSGRIKERLHEWTAENIANGFADVFYEIPVRARYWVTRYRVAVAKARRLAKPPHPIDNRLRTIAAEWFRRFGRKVDLRKIGGMLGNSRHEIFSRRQMTDILFAFMMNKLIWNDYADIQLFVETEALHKAFPGGLYGYYIDHGWSRVPFEYEQKDCFARLTMNELADGRDRENFERATKISFLCFGRANLPGHLEEQARVYLNEVLKQFRSLRDEAKEVFRVRSAKDEWSEYAEGLLNYYNQLMDLDGIINGKERMRRVPFNHRFGVTLEYLRDLKKIRRNDW